MKIQGYLREYPFLVQVYRLIDSRLQAIKNFVAEKSFVADIGADHGYLAIELAQKKFCKVVATDKNFFPAEAARKNISDAGLENFIEVRQGDGLKVLQVGEVDTICVAGMGGSLIAKILADAPEILNTTARLILQPMNGAEILKNFLTSSGWFVVDEDLAEEGGIIYEIICAEKNFSDKQTKKETSPLLKKFLIQKQKKLLRVLEEMQKSPVAVQTEKFSKLKTELVDLEKKINSHT